MIFMAVLAKEALESIKSKEKDHIKDIFEKIEEEIQRDDALKAILALNKVDDLNKLFLFLNNPVLKKEVQEKLNMFNISMENVKIDVLNSNKDLNKRIIEQGIDDVLYVSMSAFSRTGEKILGSVIAAQAGFFKDKDKEKEKNMEDMEVIEVKDNENIERKKPSDILRKRLEEEESEILRRKKLEDDIERKDKNPSMGMPNRGNPGVNGPGL